MIRQIAEPFKTDIDVTPKTLVTDIPDSYVKGTLGRLFEAEAFAKALSTGVADLSRNQDAENFVLKEVHLTVSAYDDHVIKTVFHAAVSAYASPLNLALKSESGSGKSYATTETVKFLPEEDVLFIGSQSPKVISHENGVRKTPDGRIFEELPEPHKPERCDEPDGEVFKLLMEKWKNDVKEYRKLQDSCYYEVDLRNKIIVFLESVNPETFKMLKATMSHDHDFINHKFVDDKGKVHVTRLLGAPVLIFNSLDTEYLSEFATRTLTITPNTSKEKIAAAMEISNRKSCFPWQYSSDRLNKQIIQEYIRKIRDFVKAGRIATVNPFLDVVDVFSKNQVRDMRDFTKFLELMPVYALVKLFQRPIVTICKQRFIVPTVQDFIDAKEVFDSVSQTTKTGTEQRIISFYFDYVADKANGSTVEVLTEAYNADHKQKLSSRTVRRWIERLEEIEWVDARTGEQTTEKGYVDKQKITYHPLKTTGNNAFSEMPTDLRSKLETGFDSWLKTCDIDIASHPIIILNINGTANQISIEEFVAVIKSSTLPLNMSQVSKADSDAVQENKQESTDIAETAAFSEDSTVLFYRRLAPNEPKPCDGEAKGRQCSLEAEYEILSSGNEIKPLYCKNHFTLTAKNCLENGYKLQEQRGDA